MQSEASATADKRNDADDVVLDDNDVVLDNDDKVVITDDVVSGTNRVIILNVSLCIYNYIHDFANSANLFPKRFLIILIHLWLCR